MLKNSINVNKRWQFSLYIYTKQVIIKVTLRTFQNLIQLKNKNRKDIGKFSSVGFLLFAMLFDLTILTGKTVFYSI